MSLSCQLELFFSGPLSGSISISFKASSSLKRTREIQNKSHFTVSRTLLCHALCHARIVRTRSITDTTGVFREESEGNLVDTQYFDHFIMFSNWQVMFDLTSLNGEHRASQETLDVYKVKQHWWAKTFKERHKLSVLCDESDIITEAAIKINNGTTKAITMITIYIILTWLLLIFFCLFFCFTWYHPPRQTQPMEAPLIQTKKFNK